MSRTKMRARKGRGPVRETLRILRSRIRYKRLTVKPAGPNDEHLIVADAVTYIEILQGVQNQDKNRSLGYAELWQKLDGLIPETCFDEEYLRQRTTKTAGSNQHALHGASFYRAVMLHLDDLHLQTDAEARSSDAQPQSQATVDSKEESDGGHTQDASAQSTNQSLPLR